MPNMDDILTNINTSKLLAGTAILLTNIGSKYIGLEFSKKEDKMFQKPIVRRLIIFCVAFLATRDILISLMVCLIFIIIVKRTNLFKNEEDE